MIKFVYIDNYKCFSDFTWVPGEFQLVMGDNGSGKTVLFEVVDKIKRFILFGEDISNIFTIDTLSNFQPNNLNQTIKIGISIGADQYEYQVIVGHRTPSFPGFIKMESLSVNGNLCIDVETATPTMFNTNKSLLWRTSKNLNTLEVMRFRDAMYSVYPISVNPTQMCPHELYSTNLPNMNMSNYSAWLKYLSSQDNTFIPALVNSLAEIIPELQDIVFKDIDNSISELWFVFNTGTALRIDQMSDGERCLAVMHSCMLLLKKGSCSVLLDSPDNYISLREIQPTFRGMYDEMEEGGSQLIISSHHPELINAFSIPDGVWLYRDSITTPARMHKFECDSGGITAAEMVARGWTEESEV